jgi:SAM-dependent methyltransferase
LGGKRARQKKRLEKKAKKLKKGASARSRSGRRKSRVLLTAASADKYDLYQRAVQSVEDDVEFLEKLSTRAQSRSARHLREDFCGTGLLASQWVRRSPDHTAEGFDIDPEPVAWGLARNFEPHGTSAQMRFHLADVRRPSARPPDLRVAYNFSYCCFKRRAELLEYFRSAREDLADGGIFTLDLHGGPECQEEMEEERKVDGGFTYVWEQEKFWPANHEAHCHISFEFRDGTSLHRAFSYEWRLWMMPELHDILEEAGFSRVETWWEGEDEDGEGDGNFEPDPRGDNCLSWIAYLVAWK